MKMKFRCAILAVFLLGSSAYVNAGNGIKRSDWDFRPEITCGNVVYGTLIYGINPFLGNLLTKTRLNSDVSRDDLPWWFPNTGLQMTSVDKFQYGEKIFNKLDPDAETKSGLLDWGNPDYSLGYRVHYNSKKIPFGFGFKVAYYHQSFKVKPALEDWTRFSKNMVVPELNLELLLGKYRTSNQMYVISIGARYDYAISATNIYKDKKTVNSGITGTAGFEFAIPSMHSKTGVYVSVPFYDYLNKGYTPDNGKTHPFENAKDSRWGLEMYWRWGF